MAQGFRVSPFHAATVLMLVGFDGFDTAQERNSDSTIQDGAQRPYKPVNVVLARVWKFRLNPTSAAEAASFLASGSLST